MTDTRRHSSFEQISMKIKNIRRRSIKITENTDESDNVLINRTFIYDILGNKKYLSDSVNMLLSVKGDYCLKLRFCNAVIEMENNTEKKLEMKTKADKIVGIFFNNTLFKIDSISKKDVDIAISNSFHTIFIKNNIINELINDEFFMDKIKDVINLKK